MKALSLLLCLGAAMLTAQVHPAQSIVESARTGSTGINELLTKSGVNLKQGTAFVWGQDFLFAVQTDKEPKVMIDFQPPVEMTRQAGSDIWYRLVKLRTGVTHAYGFDAAGKTIVPRKDVAGYNPDSYPKPGVPKGTLSEKRTFVSKLYEGSSADYWVYVSPGVDRSKPAPLMVWQDGQGLVGENASIRLFTVN